MGTPIIKIKDKYFLWSTIVDAPVSCGADTLEEIKELCIEREQEQIRERIEQCFDFRKERVEKKGTSSRISSSVNEVIANNHAGPNGEELSKEEIYEKYAEPSEDTAIERTDRERMEWLERQHVRINSEFCEFTGEEKSVQIVDGEKSGYGSLREQIDKAMDEEKSE